MIADKITQRKKVPAVDSIRYTYDSARARFHLHEYQNTDRVHFCALVSPAAYSIVSTSAVGFHTVTMEVWSLGRVTWRGTSSARQYLLNTTFERWHLRPRLALVRQACHSQSENKTVSTDLKPCHGLRPQTVTAFGRAPRHFTVRPDHE